MRLAIASVGKNLSASLQQQQQKGHASADGAGGEKEEEAAGDFANIERIGKLVREIKGGECRAPLLLSSPFLAKGGKLTMCD